MTSNPETAEPAWAQRYAVIQQLADIDALVHNGSVYPRWIDASTFWYDRQTRGGVEYRVVDASAATNELVVRHRDLVDALARRIGVELTADVVILRNLEVAPGARSVAFEYARRSWRYDISAGEAIEIDGEARSDLAVSPDGRRAVSVRDHDLWLHDLVDGSSARITTDGSEFHAYGAGVSNMRSVYDKYGIRAAPDGLWSPDSRWFFTLQTDERDVLDMPTTTYAPIDGMRPTVQANRQSAPGDAAVPIFRLFALDGATGAQLEPDDARIAATRMGDTPFAADLVWWSADGGTVYFVDVERGELSAHVRGFEVESRITSTRFSESADLPLEISVSLYDPALIVPLPDADQVVWYSERSGRGHLYLYDLVSGEPIRALTSGDWQVRELLHVDAERRELYFLAGGIDADEGPYVRKVCVTSLDDGRVRVLSGDAGDHRVWRRRSWDFAIRSRTTGADIDRVDGFSPGGDYFVETIGDVDRLPISTLRSRDGGALMVVETAEDVGLPDGWRWPERVTAVAADGETVVHGLLFSPPDYDAARSYPLIDLVYGSPQESLVPQAAFVDFPNTWTYVDAAGFAELGAFCLVLDGRGTANRERSFRQASFGALPTVSNLDDHRTAISVLAETRSIDLQRVAITGFSGGGYLAALGALRHGDFYSVAVAASGSYEPRLFWHGFGERYQGTDLADFDSAAAKTYASGLRGKLLLIHGLLDLGVHPAGLFQLVQALIDENKDVDLVVLPTMGHEISAYGTRRRLDYLVTHLFGSTPPTPVRMRDPRSVVMDVERADADETARAEREERAIR